MPAPILFPVNSKLLQMTMRAIFGPDQWMKPLLQPWSATMEPMMFTGWIYDQFNPSCGPR